MTESRPPVNDRRSLAFLMLFALAYGGGVIAYVPLLTLLLPMQVEVISPEQKLGLLSLATVAGAIAASVANLFAGMASDRGAGRPTGRRPWIIGGLVATLLSYVVLRGCTTPTQVVVGVVLFQVAVNALLAPLMALVADEVPDSQKGLMGGLMGAAYPLGFVAGVAATASPTFGVGAGLAITGTLVVIAMLPFLVIMRRRVGVTAAAETTPNNQRAGRRNLLLVWTARLLIQVAGSILFTYYLFYFQTVDRGGVEGDLTADVAKVAAVAALVSVPLSIGLGRLADLVGRRRFILAGTVGVMAVGLTMMGLAPQWMPATVGYGLFAVACALFLALQQTYAMQLLPSAHHRGRDLGILNLTNTLPAVVSPGLAYALARMGDFRPLMLTLAGLAVISGGLTLMVREPRTS